MDAYQNVVVANQEKKTESSTNGHSSVPPPAERAIPNTTTERRFQPLSHPNVEWLIQEIKARKVLVGALAALLVGIIVYSVVRSHHAGAGAPSGAVPVTVQTVREQNVRLWSDFSGRLQAVDYAEIRPEVSGRITDVRFEDGQTVSKGDVLFVIDPGPYVAALQRAEANAAFAKTELERADGLVKAQAIAQRLYDERANASRVADAELARARIDVSRAYVKAPISGRVSRPEITVGNVVQAGSGAPLLTSIVSDKGIYADFEVDEQTYLQSIRGHASARDQERVVPVEMVVQGDKERVYKGSIYSFDNRIDTNSGTIRARARFSNADGSLLPGMFVSVRMGSSGEVPSILVPERSIGTDQNKKFVYVVGNDNKVVYRDVALGKSVGADRVVLTGLHAGDRVIVDGTQHVRPDALVEPKEVQQVASAPASL